MLATEDLQSICDEISEGKSLRAICRDRKLAESSVRRWIAQDEALMAQTAHARELGCDSLADECIQIADDKALDPADRRVRIETRLKLIGKWSQRYSDKLAVTNTTTVTHKYDLDSLSADKLEQLETILADAERGASSTGEAVASSVH